MTLEVKTTRSIGFEEGQEAAYVEVGRLKNELGERTLELNFFMLTSDEQYVEMASTRHKLSNFELGTYKLVSMRVKLEEGNKTISSLNGSLALEVSQGETKGDG